MLVSKERIPVFLSHAFTGKVLVALVTGWLFLSVIQTIHFYWYFEQTLWNSVRWSFRDWFVWFVIFGCLFSVFSRRTQFTKFSVKNLFIVVAIAITCGFLQTFIVVSLDFIAGNPTRPFWEDFSRFYSKRWLQHLFVFAIFWLLMLNRFFVKTSVGNDVSQFDESLTTNPPVADKTQKERIQISDGKTTQWIELEDIYCIEAAGNYMCFHTNQGQLIARGSLKQTEESLDPARFIRVSRSNIVNINSIKSSHRVNRSRVELLLSNEHSVTIGPTYWRDIKSRLGL